MFLALKSSKSEFMTIIGTNQYYNNYLIYQKLEIPGELFSQEMKKNK